MVECIHDVKMDLKKLDLILQDKEQDWDKLRTKHHVKDEDTWRNVKALKQIQAHVNFQFLLADIGMVIATTSDKFAKNRVRGTVALDPTSGYYHFSPADTGSIYYYKDVQRSELLCEIQSIL